MKENFQEECVLIQLNDKCEKCNEDIFESGSISRCLKCGKATLNEISGKEYFENKMGEKKEPTMS
jgi:uncharacterized UBP type Zn finger protein